MKKQGPQGAQKSLWQTGTRGLLVRDLSSYSIQHLGKLLKPNLDQSDNSALSCCIMRRKHRNIGHKTILIPSMPDPLEFSHGLRLTWKLS